MFSGLYSSATGMKVHSDGLQTISHNLANVSTVGYKQQDMLFEDLMYQESSYNSAMSPTRDQVGAGAAVATVRTIFTQGAFEDGSSVTDLALNGDGFFQVTNGESVEYTRAGDFYFMPNGELVDPSGYNLTGIPLDKNGNEVGGLSPIVIDPTSEQYAISQPQATTSISAALSIGGLEDSFSVQENPMFSMLQAYNANLETPLAETNYSYQQPVRIYDANGVTHEVDLYLDKTSVGSSGQSVYEYVIATDPSIDGSALSGTNGAGLLMSGTLTFSSNGELIDMSAFSPSGIDKNDLSTWTPSTMSNGSPQINLTYADGTTQSFTIDFGISSNTNTWENAPASIADIGTDPANLPNMADIVRNTESTIAYGSSAGTLNLEQDGYGVGELIDISIDSEGLIAGVYTNGQTESLYSIPVFNFTSKDGLDHVGNNHYVQTKEAGQMNYGTAGTEHYGEIISTKIEASNVDYASEMVDMIIIQRGFQMNSKSVTTIDTLIQKALELKR